ncbi:MAG: hypothetical protein KatS3mg111_3784 [Pirellulaceae bacterium]|nr:MAG: hypothetical protein KatS3mg111_3784 [Pirellulaceae bacterium]
MSERAEKIRAEMRSLRRDFVESAEELTISTREMTDWRTYVQRYPWLSIGACAALGYLLVPKRVEVVSPDVTTLMKMAKRHKLVVEPQPKAAAKTGVAATVLGLLGNAVFRAGLSYLGQQVGKVAVPEAAQSVAEGSPHAPHTVPPVNR